MLNAKGISEYIRRLTYHDKKIKEMLLTSVDENGNKRVEKFSVARRVNGDPVLNFIIEDLEGDSFLIERLNSYGNKQYVFSPKKENHTFIIVTKDPDLKHILRIECSLLQVYKGS